MPLLSQLTASQVVKLLLVGDSKSGKTGAVGSLVKAGYRVRLLDFDNGWESLAAAVRRECPDKIDHVEVEPLRDKYKSSALGPIIDGSPKAFVRAMNLLDKWVDGTKPCDWGPDYVLLWDSLTFAGDAAYAWADALNPSAKDKRQIYGAAQEAIEHVLALLTGASFNTNVIVTAHVKYIDLPDGTKKGYPTAIGQALSPTIPRYFNSMAQCLTEPGDKRTIRTKSTALFDLANPKSFEMEKSLPIETGLATFFNLLRGPACQTQTKSNPQTSPSPEGQSPSPTTPIPSTPLKSSPAPIVTSPKVFSLTKGPSLLSPSKAS